MDTGFIIIIVIVVVGVLFLVVNFAIIPKIQAHRKAKKAKLSGGYYDVD